MRFAQRTHPCGDLREENSDEHVILNGWVHRVRDLGGLFFVDLRDRSGLVQLFFQPGTLTQRSEIRPEACLSVSGIVKMRSEATRNPRMATGDIEIIVSDFQVLGTSKPLPFPVSDEEQMLTVNEELRIKYRYLDLRRPEMYRRMAVRSSLVNNLRAYLDDQNFIEVETPIITKSTPEGARDYLVAYRLQPGLWYALPQSPQQYKQLLMVGGIEKYYQIAKCFRDESQRADRLPEFTQLDLEMSFCVQEDILQLTEGMIRSVLNHVVTKFQLEKDEIDAFERITYEDALDLYGSDKPDLRFELQLFDISTIAKTSNFGVFKNAIELGGVVKGIRYPHGAALSRKEVGILEDIGKELGAKGMATLAVEEIDSKLVVKGSIAKFFDENEIAKILEISQAESGDLLCFIADSRKIALPVLSRLRLEIGDRLALRDPRKLKFCWVLDFPLVEWDEATQRWDPTHHPFTMPKSEDIQYLESNPGRIKADCYDMVCNGSELASGSIRIHNSEIQAKIFDLLGIDEATQKERFGHILEAFTYGAPPHGGIAPGIDRILMCLFDTDNVREVIAFPKVGGGYDPLMDAPSIIDPQQWAELGLKVVK